MKSFMIIVFTILFIQSPCVQSGNKSKMVVLNLAESFSKQQEVFLSRFVNKISYVPLETNRELLISGHARFEVTDEFIIVKNDEVGGKYQILLFDRNTGKFIREIGKQGRGPGEYSTNNYLPFNSVKKELYAQGPSREIIVYDLLGRNIDKIKIPEWIDPKIPKETNPKFPDFQKIGISSRNMLDSNTFVGYIQNFSGWEKRKLALFSKEGILKIFPNHLTWNRENWKVLYFPPGQFAKFHKWDNKLNFIETFCDTLYQVTKDSLLPRYFFDWGKFNAPYSKQGEVMSHGHIYDYFFLIDIDENKNYIFIRIVYKGNNYTGFIEKRNNSVTFCKIGTSNISGLRDDITGLMDVVPEDFTENNEMVYVIQPVKLINWFKENPEKAEKARNKLPWLKDIDEFSNPIIAIGKCKD